MVSAVNVDEPLAVVSQLLLTDHNHQHDMTTTRHTTTTGAQRLQCQQQQRQQAGVVVVELLMSLIQLLRPVLNTDTLHQHHQPGPYISALAIPRTLHYK